MAFLKKAFMVEAMHQAVQQGRTRITRMPEWHQVNQFGVEYNRRYWADRDGRRGVASKKKTKLVRKCPCTGCKVSRGLWPLS